MGGKHTRDSRSDGSLRTERERHGPGPLPDFLIVGAMKSGTTSLARYLRPHPEVFMARGKEVHFFDLNFERGIDWYRRQFSGVGNERAVGEATPQYMAQEDAPPRMAALLPEARLIAILRNPIDRAYSHYWHQRARGKETLEFSEALSVEHERLASPDPQRHLYSYLARSRYVHQLVRLEKHYPREAIHVLLFEELRDRPRETYASVCRFLGVDDSFIPGNLGERAGQFQGIRFPKLRTITRILPPRLRHAIDRINAPLAEYPPLDPGTRAELARRFQEDNAALASWLGRDLSVWNE